MFAGEMRQSYALSLIDKFPPLSKGRPFPRIDQADVVAGLRERVNDPHKQAQGAASLCGPAAFFYRVLNFKPELYVQYVIDLFTTGKARWRFTHRLIASRPKTKSAPAFRTRIRSQSSRTSV